MLYYKMKYYNQNDLILVFGIIVIGYFALRYLMTRKLLEGQASQTGGTTLGWEGSSWTKEDEQRLQLDSSVTSLEGVRRLQPIKREQG